MDWNAVVTVREEGFGKATQMLRRFGEVRRSSFFNVLVMKVEDPSSFLDSLEEQAEDDPRWEAVVSRVVAGGSCFSFTSPGDFETKALEAAKALAPQLAGKSFHVRVHRRGLKDRISSQSEEALIADGVLAVLREAGHEGRVTFENPDAIVVVETVGDRACVSSWTHAEQERYRFLRVD
jgi:tRNA(Ser,Leu) C12 N-acetylase TAN1